MKKILLPAFLFLLSFHFSIAQVAIESQQETQSDSTKSTEVVLEKSLLWEISGNGLQTPSFLYGTIHIINRDDFLLTDETKTAFDKSERVTFEINMEEMNDLSTMFTLFSKIMMPNGMTLKDLLSEEDYDFVQKEFAELGLPAMMMGIFDRIKPMFLTTFASGDMDPNGLQNGEMVSYEMEFMGMAQQMEKEMAGLETIEYQISIFDSIPLNDQAEMLVESLKAESQGSDQFQQMVDMYLDQDIEKMQDMFKNEEDGIAEYEDVLLVNRNRNWIPIMRGMMKEKPTFFAVGAGHLGGKNGVIKLLRKAGYTLKPLQVSKSK